MRLKVLTENIRLVPSICEQLEGEFALIFRQPTQADVIEFATVQTSKEILDVMNSLFIEFENKPEIEDENGDLIEYETLADLFKYSNGVISSVMTDVVLKFKDIRKSVFEIEKK